MRTISGPTDDRRRARLRSRHRRVSPALRESWARLSAEIRTCQKCPLGLGRTNAVVYRGTLAPRLVFVGEAPGSEEDRTGIPFVGRSGHLLDEAVEALGLSSSEFGVLNVLKCRPPGNRFDRAAARTCRPYLDRQLELLRPELLVPLGARALAAVDPHAPPMLKASGRHHSTGTTAYFPLLHPAAALRSRRLRKRWDHDVRALGRWLVRWRA